MNFSDIIVLYEANYEKLFGFSEFENKLKNRITEFEAISKYLPRKSIYNVLSFPADYDFERSFYNKFKIPLNVYVMQTNFSIGAANKFIQDTNQMNSVLVPIKTSKGKYLPKTNIRSGDIVGIKQVRYAPVSATRKGVLQGYEYLPQKLDLIDLDYMGAFSPKLLGQAGTLYDEKLDNGGLLFVTFNISGYRELSATLSSTAKELQISPDDPMLKKFKDIKKKINKPIDFFGQERDYTKYGIAPDRVDKFKSIAFNIVNELKRVCGNKDPIYANIYKGGKSAHGQVMLRVVFKK